MKNLLKIIFWLAVVYLICLFCSCSPQKRMQRLIRLHPELAVKDTLHIKDTLYTPRLETDSVFKLDTITRVDTFKLEKEKLKVKVIIQKDSIYISGTCERDTIFYNKNITTEKILPCPPPKEASFWEQIKSAATWLIIGAAAMGVFILFVRR